jgi:serine/threonine-protein kinase RsbW
VQRPAHPKATIRANPRRLKTILESKVESANEAATLIVGVAKHARFDEEEVHEIELAVREAVANAVLHGNCCDSRKKVFLAAELRAASLVIHVRDEGRGFDLGPRADPRHPEYLLRESGRGLFLMETYMDEVVLRRSGCGGMELTMTKYRSRRC